jgi:hypothetical protein
MGSENGGSILRAVYNLLLLLLVFSVLGSITLPCRPYIPRGRGTRAVKEIRRIELAVTKLLSDAGKNNLRDLYDEGAFNTAVADLVREQGMDAFDASVELYTNSTYGLLRKGRDLLDLDEVYVEVAVLDRDVVQELGTSYMPDLAFDPWGNLYQFYPGPWPDDMGPVIFRTYLPSLAELKSGRIKPTDQLLMEGIAWQTKEDIIFGWPADAEMNVYIWSYGANLESGQPRYDPTHQYVPPAFQYYDQRAQEPEFFGGGDDINNWDRDQTFMRFYN